MDSFDMLYIGELRRIMLLKLEWWR